jgi:carbamoyltransferase
VVLEERLLTLARRLHDLVSSPRLAYAGGVALNCVANRRLRRDGPFRELFVQPAAGDSGGSLGAAALAHRQLTGRRPSISPSGRLEHAAYGPSFSTDEIDRFARATGLAFERPDDLGALTRIVARHLAEGAVVGWFTGALELGPRALGSRSILASPLVPDMRRRINALVKKREGFRPFAPAVLAEHAGDHFDLAAPSPFMLETARVTSPLDLPAITHVDGSARPQTVDRRHLPRFAALLDAFHRRTGCPLLLNTSFNVRGEPIVATPADALLTMASAGLDLLVLEDRLLHRADLPEHLPALVDLWRTPKTAAGRSALSGHLYTFV